MAKVSLVIDRTGPHRTKVLARLRQEMPDISISEISDRCERRVAVLDVVTHGLDLETRVAALRVLVVDLEQLGASTTMFRLADDDAPPPHAKARNAIVVDDCMLVSIVEAQKRDDAYYDSVLEAAATEEDE